MSYTTTITNAQASKPQQPDIQYHPDMEKFRARTARRLAENPDLPNMPLPDGFPQKVEGPIVWEGADWTNEDQWVYNLSTDQLTEIDNALAHFQSKRNRILNWKIIISIIDLKLPMGYISRDTFPLPNLSDVLKGLAGELYSGRGFFVLRAIPIDKYSRAELAIVYAGK